MTEKEIEEYLISKSNHHYIDTHDILKLIKNEKIKVSERGLNALIEIWDKGFQEGWDEAYG